MNCNRYDLSKIGSSLTNHKTKLPKSSEPIIASKSCNWVSIMSVCHYKMSKHDKNQKKTQWHNH